MTAASSLPVVAGSLAFLVATTLGWLMLRTGLMLSAVDRPNERSLHTKPTPRVGGIPLLLGAFAGSGVAAATPHSNTLLTALAGGVLALALVGALDDRFGLRARTRFVWQLTSSAVAVALLHPLLDRTVPASIAPWALYAALVISITWSANLYNFMDGSDGLAGSMAVWGFGVLSLIANLQGALDLGVVSGALSGGALGFLRFNWHPARMFMGDVGSVPLGFAASIIGIEGAARGIWPPWTPLVAFWPFAFDASLTVARRLLRGAKVWEAHREHLYQKLVQMGWGHRRTAWVETGAMAVCALLALLLRPLSLGQGAPLLAGLLLTSAACARWVDARWKEFEG